MKCFYHLEREADGECRSCGKPLCNECKAAAGASELCVRCRKRKNTISDALNPVWGILSIIVPGLGQLARGEYVKSVALFIVVVFAFSGEQVLLGLIVWAAGAWDGFSPIVSEDELGISGGSKRWVVGVVLMLLGLILLPGIHGKVFDVNIVIPGTMVVLGTLLLTRKAASERGDNRNAAEDKLEEGG